MSTSTLADTVKGVLPFVPALDFELATRFYRDLGFQCPNEDDDVRYFSMGPFGFLLQDFYVEDWANNFMLNMHVEDIERWHQHIRESGLIDKYPGTRVSKPGLEDWGMIVMHLWDPSGVLWHITQKPDA
jgi:hypothetical protein